MRFFFTLLSVLTLQSFSLHANNQQDDAPKTYQDQLEAIYQEMASNPSSAEQLLVQFLAEAEASGDAIWLGEAQELHMTFFYQQGEFQQAEQWGVQALENYRGNHPEKTATILFRIGLLYHQQGFTDEAMQYYFEALEIGKELEDKTASMHIMGNMGTLYLDLGQLERGIEIFERGLEIALAEKADRQAGIFYNNIGSCQQEMGQLESAMNSYQEAMTLFESLDDPMGKLRTHHNIGKVLLDIGQEEKAITHLESALYAAETLGSPYELNAIRIALGKAFLKTGNARNALALCTKVANNVKELYMFRVERDACQCAAQAHEALGNKEAAAEFTALYEEIEDELRKEEETREAIQAEYEARYQEEARKDSILFEKEKLLKEREIALLEEETSRKNQLLYIWGGGILGGLILIVGIVFLVIYLTKRSEGR